jgi:hypothetical protein
MAKNLVRSLLVAFVAVVIIGIGPFVRFILGYAGGNSEVRITVESGCSVKTLEVDGKPERPSSSGPLVLYLPEGAHVISVVAASGESAHRSVSVGNEAYIFVRCAPLRVEGG